MTYADWTAPLHEVLHGAARLHVALGRAEGAEISTRGWTYNDLVDGVLALSVPDCPAEHMSRCIETMFDTLDGVCDIGPRAVEYLHDLRRMDGD